MTLLAFALSGALLVAVALGFVLPPLLRAAPPAARPGHLPAPPRARRTAAALTVAVPLAAAGLYTALGTPAALDAGAPPGSAAVTVPSPAADAGHRGGGIGPTQVNAMVQRLADRLRQQPDDVDGWRMLARSHEKLGRFDEASRDYEQLERLLPNDAAVLTDHAVALAMSLGQRLDGEPERLIRRALRIDPRNVQALALAGSAAYEREDYAAAVAEWQKILALVPPDDDMARTIGDSILKAKSRAVQQRQPVP